jgi:predicted alpha/beta superfamily hydrolase
MTGLRWIGWVAALGWSLASLAMAAPAQVVSQGPAVQEGAQKFILHSKIIGGDFPVVVTLPAAPLAPGKKFPVIYALDGGYGVVGPVVRQFAVSGGMQNSLVVSVDYPDGQRDISLLHSRVDNDGRTLGGGGKAFEAFLLDELRPFIEARYPADPDNSILFGHSFGGVFTANVLADRPEAFRGYLIASPSVWADPGLPDRLSAAVGRAGARQVYVAVGGKEAPRMLDGEKRIVSILTAPNSRLSVQSHAYEGAGHITYYPQLILTAFAWFLPPKPTQ